MNNNNNQAAVSVSMSAESTQSQVKVDSGVVMVDEMFPLFNVVFQQANIPILFVYPFLVFFFLQVVIIANWPWQEFWAKNDIKGTMDILRNVFFFTPSDAGDGYYFVVAVVIFAINLVTFVLIRFQLSYYKIQRKFIKVLNYPIRFYYDTLLIVTLMPTSIGIGETLVRLAHGVTSYQVIVAFILNIFIIAFESFSFIIVQGFASKSVHVNPSPLLNFDPSVMIMTLVGLVSVIILYFILSLFEAWAKLFAIGLHMLVYIYLFVYIVRHLPFVDMQSQSLSCGWFLGCIMGDIIMIISHFVPKFNYNIPLGLTFGTFLFCVPVFLVINIIRVKKIVANLSQDIRNEEEANEYFANLGLENNEAKALLYLRVAFQNYSVSFYNWSLVNYIITHYSSELALNTCLQLVNFFPKETRLLNRIQRQILTRRKLSFTTRFLLFQVDQVKTLRQFSVSSQSKLKLIELKTMSKQCEMLTRGAVDSPKLNPGYFENLANKTHLTHAVWVESLENSPNNPKFCEEFTRYLVEAECDFPEALKYKHRAQIIEMGNNFSVDTSFRSMVRAFPKYLTKKILDLRGTVIELRRKEPSRSASSSQSSNQSGSDKNSANSTLNGDESLDADVEEFVGKQTIIHSRTRLALHRALENKLPASMKSIIPATFLIIIFVIVIFAFAFIYSSQRLETQTTSLSRLDYISQLSFYYSIANVNLIFTYTQEHGVLQHYLPSMNYLMRFTDPIYVNVLADMLLEAVGMTTNASWYFEDLINSVASLALEGENIYNFAQTLILPEGEITICDNDANNITKIPESFSSLAAMMITHQRQLAGNKTVNNLLKDPNYCEIFFNFDSFYDMSSALFDSFCNYQKDSGAHLKEVFGVLSIIIPCITFIVVFIPVIVIHFLTVKSLKEVVEIIHSFDQKAKTDAKALITIHASDDDNKSVEMTGSSRTSIILISIICFLSLCLLLCSLVICILVVNANTKIIHLNSWNQYASLRLSLSAASLYTLIYALAMHDLPNEHRMTTIEDLVNKSLILTDKLVDADIKLINGFDETPGCQGFDKVLDSYNVIDKTSKPKIGDSHDFYATTSLHQQVDVYAGFMKALSHDLLDPDAQVNEMNFANAQHIINAHMWMRMVNVTKRMIDLANMEYTNIMQNIIVLSVCVCVLLIAFIIAVSFYYQNRSSAFKASLFILKRFNPATLVNNKLFSHRFLKTKDGVKDDKLSVEASIIHNAPDAIFLTSSFGVVEIVNKSVASLLGYTPEQILGQHISSFFTTADEEKISTKLEMMKSGQSSTFVEEDMNAVTDNSAEVPCHVSIIGMKGSNGDINSFTIILRDQTALVQQMKTAEEAKAKSEKLLYQILPRDIVVQLNRGEKDISFTVPSATIVFIDIQKFSEYAASLSPQDIMANLSLYFAALDKIAAKYNMITKIKLIGDIYMAATGLFNPDVPPESHAEQTVQFGLDSIAELDEVNMRLDASLTIRVGVNTGGPIIAGVLGTDKPAFDIIGDAINVAARLQSTCEVNHVHISQATYDLIKGMNFDVQAKGETFLKGKGKQMTYLVNPTPSVFQGTGSFMRS